MGSEMCIRDSANKNKISLSAKMYRAIDRMAKDGIEKYTTEVVLQNFNGNLTMLGGRNDNSSSDFGNDSISSESTSISSDMDDDIPF